MSHNYKIDLYSIDSQCFNSHNPYRFGFNGQACPPFWRKKDDEVAGAGNTNTATFWEYDTRLGRRWNLDPKPQINISDYAVMGDNPIVNVDWLGDIWGKPGDKEDNEVKKQADELKIEFTIKRDEYKKEYEDLNKKMLDFYGDSISPEFKDLYDKRAESHMGMLTIEGAIKGIDEIGKDKNNYSFKVIDGGFDGGFVSSVKLKGNIHQITSNYTEGENKMALKAHEYWHGLDIARFFYIPKYAGLFSNYTEKFKKAKGTGRKTEIGAYMLQYFFDASSMPATIFSYKEILNWDELKVRINKAAGYDL